MDARAGSRAAAFRKMELSIMPPCVGSGCRQIIVATGGASCGIAISPTSSNPSAVVKVSGSRRAGSTELARIGHAADMSEVLHVRVAEGRVWRHTTSPANQTATSVRSAPCVS